MVIRSAFVLDKHFAQENLQEIIDFYIVDGTARGVDGTDYKSFMKIRDHEVNLISSRVLSGSYKFSAYRQKLILKDSVSLPRQVSIPTLRDRITLRALNNVLNEIFSDCRPQHAHPVISSVLSSIEKMTDDDCFVKLDIKAFYDNINHEVLLKNLGQRIRYDYALDLIKKAIRKPTGAKISSGAVNKVGVPQGLSISNILSSIYLKSIDDKFSSQLGRQFHRYVDDILLICPEMEGEQLFHSIFKELKRKKKLSCHKLGSGKSSIVSANETVTYLGYNLNRSKISVRPASEKKLMSSIMQILWGAPTDKIDQAIWRINLRITGCKLCDARVGWIFYFNQISDKQLLAKMDAQIRSAAVRKFGDEKYGRIKKLLTSYHEAKYNWKNSNYFPNFDSATRDQMLADLALFPHIRTRNWSSKSDTEIRRIHQFLVRRETKRMERDTLGGFS